jgi:hypothetical protein
MLFTLSVHGCVRTECASVGNSENTHVCTYNIWSIKADCRSVLRSISAWTWCKPGLHAASENALSSRQCTQERAECIGWDENVYTNMHAVICSHRNERINTLVLIRYSEKMRSAGEKRGFTLWLKIMLSNFGLCKGSAMFSKWRIKSVWWTHWNSAGICKEPI